MTKKYCKCTCTFYKMRYYGLEARDHAITCPMRKNVPKPIRKKSRQIVADKVRSVISQLLGLWNADIGDAPLHTKESIKQS